MSIVITKQPAQLVAAENDIIIEGYENNIASGWGASVRAFMQLQAFHLLWDFIEIHFTGIGISTFTMTCQETITNPANQYPVRTTETLAEWGEKIRDMFLRNAFIVNNFKVTTKIEEDDGYYEIYFEPYIKDGSVGMTFYDVSVSVGIATQDSSYVAPTYNQNLSLSLQMFIEIIDSQNQKTLEKNGTNPLTIYPVIANRRANGRWNLKTMIRNEYTGHFTFPLDGTRHFHYIIDRYIANIFSNWGDPPVAQNNAFTNEFYVLDAKLSKTKIREMNTATQGLIDLLIQEKKFLTFAPLEKTTDIYAPEKLYFLFHIAYTNALFKIKEYYTDGTDSTRTITTFSTTSWSIAEFECGFQTIKLDDYTTPGLTPFKWDAWLESSTGAMISEIRTFLIDTSYQASARYFLIKNRFGVYESFRSTGMGKKIISWEKTFFEKDVEEPTIEDHDRLQLNESNKIKIELNTGWLPIEWNMYYADELFASRDVYWIKNDKKYRVTIDESTPTAQEDEIYLNGFPFIVEISDMSDSIYDDFEIPQLPVSGDFNGDFNDDYLI